MTSPNPLAVPADTKQRAAHVLIVDDDAISRAVSSEMLQLAGYRTSEAGDGIEAQQFLRDQHVDLIVLDVVMPNMDGFATCRWIRAEYIDPLVPVLMLTGLDDIQSINDAYLAGATDFIAKPFNPQLLPFRVRYLLRSASAMRSAQENEQRLRQAYRINQMGEWEWNFRQHSLQCSGQAAALLGLPEQTSTLSLRAFLRCLAPADRQRVIELLQTDAEPGLSCKIELETLTRTDEPRVLLTEWEYDNYLDGSLRCIGTFRDITVSKQVERRVHQLAFYDRLTGLPNRTLIQATLTASINAAVSLQQSIAIFVVGLDNFKFFNDAYGHNLGDQILLEVSRRLTSALTHIEAIEGPTRPAQTNLGRLSGDEFLVFLRGDQVAQYAGMFAERLLNSCGHSPIVIGQHELFVTASIGIALYPNHGDKVEALLQYSDSALYQAKVDGRNSYNFHSQELTKRWREKLILASSLRNALENGQLQLYLQPKFSIPTRTLVGAEALLRWQHPDRGMISPVHFIPVAEEFGLINSLGRWVMNAVATQLCYWTDMALPLVPIAINASSHHLRNTELFTDLERLLRTYHLSPGLLEVELTESCLIWQVEHTIKHMKLLQSLGIRISIDDFGTGYSSLSYLNKLPIDSVKIDRSFIQGITQNSSEAALAGAIIRMAKCLNLHVVAEGVETEAQFAWLARNNCDVAQGFLLGKPMPVELFTALLRQQQTARRIAG